MRTPIELIRELDADAKKFSKVRYCYWSMFMARGY
jgi:hypothetical protein